MEYILKLNTRSVLQFNFYYTRTLLTMQNRRRSSKGPGYEVLIKWASLGFDHCTWELEGTTDGTFDISKYPKIYESFLNSRFRAF